MSLRTITCVLILIKILPRIIILFKIYANADMKRINFIEIDRSDSNSQIKTSNFYRYF